MKNMCSEDVPRIAAPPALLTLDFITSALFADYTFLVLLRMFSEASWAEEQTYPRHHIKSWSARLQFLNPLETWVHVATVFHCLVLALGRSPLERSRDRPHILSSMSCCCSELQWPWKWLPPSAGSMRSSRNAAKAQLNMWSLFSLLFFTPFHFLKNLQHKTRPKLEECFPPTQLAKSLISRLRSSSGSVWSVGMKGTLEM